MTESDWLVCGSASRMLTALGARGRLTERKVRLFGCGCCRLVWDALADDRGRIATRKLEAQADDLENRQLLRDAHNTANAAFNEARRRDTGFGPATAAAGVVVFAARVTLAGGAPVVPPVLYGNLARVQVDGRGLELDAARRLEADLVRDLFGNPFSPAAFSPSWRTEAVVALARGIYERAAWERMQVLADALEDAGCTDREVLEHCRAAGPHYRGCWVVDAVLGRE